jgi:hypothetical protein
VVWRDSAPPLPVGWLSAMDLGRFPHDTVHRALSRRGLLGAGLAVAATGLLPMTDGPAAAGAAGGHTIPLPAPTGRYPIGVGDIRFVLDALHLDRVGMLGYSVGGFAAAQAMLTDRLDPYRCVAVQRAYLTAFFDRHLRPAQSAAEPAVRPVPRGDARAVVPGGGSASGLCPAR